MAIKPRILCILNADEMYGNPRYTPYLDAMFGGFDGGEGVLNPPTADTPRKLTRIADLYPEFCFQPTPISGRGLRFDLPMLPHACCSVGMDVVAGRLRMTMVQGMEVVVVVPEYAATMTVAVLGEGSDKTIQVAMNGAGKQVFLPPQQHAFLSAVAAIRAFDQFGRQPSRPAAQPAFTAGRFSVGG